MSSIEKRERKARPQERQQRAVTISENESTKYEDNFDEPVSREFRRRKSRRCRIIAELWETQQMVKNTNRDLEMQVTLRELIFYIVFLILLLIVAIGMTSSTMYYYTTVMSGLFLDTEFTDGDRTTTFKTCTRMGDFWPFAELVLIDGFFWDFWYKRAELGVATLPDEMEQLFLESKVLGLPRLRQVRVTSNSCSVHRYFSSVFEKCYDYYSESVEDKEPLANNTEGTAWRYWSEEELEGSRYNGQLATYGGGGYVQDLPLDRQGALDVIGQLKTNRWLDRGTRAIFIDFTVYNANINLFCIIRLIMEIPPTGGVVPTYSLRTVKLIRYVTLTDHFVLACEVMFLLFLLFYTSEELREMAYFKGHYFKSYWNMLDFTIIVMGYVCLGLSVYRNITIKETLRQLLAKRDDPIHEDFSSLGYWQVTYNHAISVCLFFAWLKIFKYITFSRSMNQLNGTVLRCRRDVLGFGVMFFLLFGAFAQLGYLLFGAQVVSYRSVIISVYTLFRTILGDFDFVAMEKANRVLGPTFFLMYIFFIFFILMNMFLAIIADTYAEVRTEITAKRNELQLSDFLVRGLRNIFRCFPEKKTETSEERIREMLRQHKYTDLEIEMFFSKYYVDENKMISESETELQLATPNPKRKNGSVTPVGVSASRFRSLESRVNRLETSIANIVAKANMVVARLGNTTMYGKVS